VLQTAVDGPDARPVHPAVDQVVPGRRTDHLEIHIPVEARNQALGAVDIGGRHRIGLPVHGGPEQVGYDGHQGHVAPVQRCVEGNLVDVLDQQIVTVPLEQAPHHLGQYEVGHRPVAVPVDIHPVDDIVPRRPPVASTDQVDVPAGCHGTLENVVQVQFRPTPEGIFDVAPIDRQDPQDTASGLRATTPMVGVV